MDINNYKELKDKLNNVNQRIAVVNGKKSALVEQVKVILAKHGVAKVSELRELYEARKAEADKVAEEVSAFIADAEEKLNKAESVL